MFRRFSPLFLGVGLAAQITPPQVPEILKPPGAETILLKAVGSGKQIYACQASGWVLERPQAELSDSQGKIIGKHYQGPTWEAADGSKVVGEVQQHANSPHAGAIPWLLLKAKSTQGTGIFGHVTYIQRVNTVGGAAPPDGCDRSHTNAEVAIDYHADYYFYK